MSSSIVELLYKRLPSCSAEHVIDVAQRENQGNSHDEREESIDQNGRHDCSGKSEGGIVNFFRHVD